MNTFAQILNGVVTNIEQFDMTLEQLGQEVYNLNMVNYQDITNLNPQPQVGWTANNDGTFTSPVVPVVNPNVAIYAQVKALESQQTPRMYREAATGSTLTYAKWVNADGTFRTSAQQLAWLEQQIVALRAQMDIGR
jgi:hypothetical protein